MKRRDGIAQAEWMMVRRVGGRTLENAHPNARERLFLKYLHHSA